MLRRSGCRDLAVGAVMRSIERWLVAVGKGEVDGCCLAREGSAVRIDAHILN